MQKTFLLGLAALSLLSTPLLAQTATNSFPATGTVTIGTATTPTPLYVNGTVYTYGVAASSFGVNFTDLFTYGSLHGTNYGVQWLTDPWTNAGPTGWLSAWGGLKFFTAGVPRFAINYSGQAAIGTDTPGGDRFTVVSGSLSGGMNILANTANNTLFSGGHSLTCTSNNFTGGMGFSVGANNSGFIQAFSPTTENGNLFLNPNGGNVGIGTTNPQGYELAVNGSAIFTQAVVKAYANWPDYVFGGAYQPCELDTLSNFIHKWKHLPGVPDAETIRKDGQDLGQLQQVQMEKIEELTLYAIDADKRLHAQDSVIGGQQRELDALKAEVEELKAVAQKK